MDHATDYDRSKVKLVNIRRNRERFTFGDLTKIKEALFTNFPIDLKATDVKRPPSVFFEKRRSPVGRVLRQAHMRNVCILFQQVSRMAVRWQLRMTCIYRNRYPVFTAPHRERKWTTCTRTSQAHSRADRTPVTHVRITQFTSGRAGLVTWL